MSDQPESGKHERQAGEHPQTEPDVPVGLKPVTGSVADPEPNPDQNQADRAVAPSAWSFAKLVKRVQWLFVLNLAVALGAGFQAYFAYRSNELTREALAQNERQHRDALAKTDDVTRENLTETRKANEASNALTREQLESARQDASANQEALAKSFGLASEQLRAYRKMAELTEMGVERDRPLIEAEFIPSNDMFRDIGRTMMATPDRFMCELQISIKNHGRFTAVNIRYNFDVAFQSKLRMDDRNTACERHTGSRALLAADGTATVRQSIMFGGFSDQDRLFRAPDSRVVPIVFGCIQYSSASFKEAYETSISAALLFRRSREVQMHAEAVDVNMLTQALPATAEFVLMPTKEWNYVK